MVTLVNRAQMTTSTTGTGTITLGSASTGYQDFATAGVTDGDTVSYTIVDGDNWECGTGTYTSSGTTLSRTVLDSNNSGSAINLSGSAVVFVTALADHMVVLSGWTITESGGTLYFATSGTNKAKLDSSGNLTVTGNVTAYGTV